MIKRKIKTILEELFGVSIIRKDSPIPGMVSSEERRFFTSCSRMMREKPGDIVNLGTWMGASTASLAEGLKEPENNYDIAHGKIYTIDRFIWQDYMSVGYINSRLIGEYKPGENFLPEARKNLKKYGSAIELIEADLSEYQWKGNGIKLLLIDAMKGWELCSHIARVFYPKLQKDSLVIQQDFKHWYTPMIHILQYRLRDYFTFYHEVEFGGTVAFKTKKEIPEKSIDTTTDFSGVTDQEVEKIFEYSFSLVSEQSRPAIAAAHVMYFVFKKQLPRANELFRHYSEKGYAAQDNMKKTKAYMMQFE